MRLLFVVDKLKNSLINIGFTIIYSNLFCNIGHWIPMNYFASSLVDVVELKHVYQIKIQY